MPEAFYVKSTALFVSILCIGGCMPCTVDVPSCSQLLPGLLYILVNRKAIYQRLRACILASLVNLPGDMKSSIDAWILVSNTCSNFVL